MCIPYHPLYDLSPLLFLFFFLFFLITHQSIFIGKTTAKYKIDLRRPKIAISLFTFNYETE